MKVSKEIPILQYSKIATFESSVINQIYLHISVHTLKCFYWQCTEIYLQYIPIAGIHLILDCSSPGGKYLKVFWRRELGKICQDKSLIFSFSLILLIWNWKVGTHFKILHPCSSPYVHFLAVSVNVDLPPIVGTQFGRWSFPVTGFIASKFYHLFTSVSSPPSEYKLSYLNINNKKNLEKCSFYHNCHFPR